MRQFKTVRARPALSLALVCRNVISSPSLASGSVASRYNQCGKSNCACHDDPPKLHGPYWRWTAKVDGKTVNRRLSEREAHFYNEWIANDRHVRALLVQMREIAAKAAELMFSEELGG